MSETIPEDIREKAETVRHQFWSSKGVWEEVDAISQALLSERKDTMERAAEVAEATGKRLAEGAIGYAIAKAIRALSKAWTD